jgi:hypothetical protein
MSEGPLSVKVSVNRCAAQESPTIRQNCAETRPLPAKAM